MLDFVHASSRQDGFVQIIKVMVLHGLSCRDPLWGIVDQHFLSEKERQNIVYVDTIHNDKVIQERESYI